MLSFDLETTGLNPATCAITCACAYDPERGIERHFLFPLGDDPEEFLQLLDESDRLCAFNGARFDIPFLQVALDSPLCSFYEGVHTNSTVSHVYWARLLGMRGFTLTLQSRTFTGLYDH